MVYNILKEQEDVGLFPFKNVFLIQYAKIEDYKYVKRRHIWCAKDKNILFYSIKFLVDGFVPKKKLVYGL